MDNLRTIAAAALLMAVGAIAAAVVLAWRSPDEPPPALEPAVTARSASERRPGFGERRADRGGERAALEQRIAQLEASLAREAAERQRLAERLEEVTSQLATAERGAGQEAELAAAPREGHAAPAAAGGAPEVVDGGAEQPPAAAAPAPVVDYSLSDMERALVSAGVDRATATDIKRRDDELTMSEMHLRDLATREEWVDTPRFEAEMAEIALQRTSVRDEIGDEAYDRFLYAQGRTNRVRIDDVLTDSPAAVAGLQAHDMILRYGDTRIFAPDELVAETRGGTSGELIRLEVVRNGERLFIDVPRGPLGLRIAPTQGQPTT